MMSSRPNRMVYTPITRGHKPTASQESNTLSTMSEVSCTTTLSMESEVEVTDKEEESLEDFIEDNENDDGWRCDSEETVVVGTAGDDAKRMKCSNSEYGSYCNSPVDL